MNQQDKVLEFLQNGGVLTTSQAKRMGVAAPAKIINRLRADGHCIYTNRRNRQANYRLGTPRESIVKTAFAVHGARAFD